MKDIFLISDTHFQHANILKFEPARSHFNDVNEMDEHMIERWNSVVKPGDKVYHLGDVFFGNKHTFYTKWNRLNGRKKLIVGNHDHILHIVQNALVDNIYMWRILPEFGLILSHVPLHPETLREPRTGSGEVLNIHGHTHGNGSPVGPYRSVCVEMINYTPINIEEVRVK